MDKQPTITLIESLFTRSKEYAGNRFELLKLKAIDKSSAIVSTIVAGIALFIILFIFFVIFNIGIALLISDLIGKLYAGFLILAAFYAIAGLVVFKGRNKFFKAPVAGILIRKFL